MIARGWGWGMKEMGTIFFSLNKLKTYWELGKVRAKQMNTVENTFQIRSSSLLAERGEDMLMEPAAS